MIFYKNVPGYPQIKHLHCSNINYVQYLVMLLVSNKHPSFLLELSLWFTSQ